MAYRKREKSERKSTYQIWVTTQKKHIQETFKNKEELITSVAREDTIFLIHFLGTAYHKNDKKTDFIIKYWQGRAEVKGVYV